MPEYRSSPRDEGDEDESPTLRRLTPSSFCYTHNYGRATVRRPMSAQDTRQELRDKRQELRGIRDELRAEETTREDKKALRARKKRARGEMRRLKSELGEAGE